MKKKEKKKKKDFEEENVEEKENVEFKITYRSTKVFVIWRRSGKSMLKIFLYKNWRVRFEVDNPRGDYSVMDPNCPTLVKGFKVCNKKIACKCGDIPSDIHKEIEVLMRLKAI